jgi:hypothetical protein
MKIPLIAGFCGLFLVSCVPATPAARIQREPGKFAELSHKNQDLVRKGLIARGMTPTAVELAWGRPNQVLEGSKSGKATMRWDYEGSRPVYEPQFFGSYGYGYGYGYGRCGPRRFTTLEYGYGPEVTYVPYRLATVQFVNSRVESWERAR